MYLSSYFQYGQIVVYLELQSRPAGVTDYTKTPVHVLHVPETASVLQPPHLVPSPVLLVGHPDVVLVRLHSQHSPPLQHGLNVLPRSLTLSHLTRDQTRVLTWLLCCWWFSCRAEPNKTTHSIRSQVVVNDSSIDDYK